MKKLILSIAILALLLGCEKKPENEIVTSQGKAIDSWYGDEYCYKGVVYVVFGVVDGKWGGPMFNPDGTVVTCGKKQ